MSLDMYLNEEEEKVTAENKNLTKMYEGFQALKKAVDSFNLDTSLQGKTYESAKKYVTEVYGTLATAMMTLTKGLSQENSKYIKDFASKVDTGTVREDQLRQNLNSAQRMQRLAQSMNETKSSDLARFMMQTAGNQAKEIDEELRNLYEYNGTAYFVDVQAQISKIQNVLSQLKNASLYNSVTGTFSTGALNTALSDLRKTTAQSEKVLQISYYMKTYGMNKELASEMVNFTAKFNDYANKHHWTVKKRNYEYAMLIASLPGIYGGIKWEIAGGLVSSSAAKSQLEKMGFDKIFLKNLIAELHDNHDPKRKNKHGKVQKPKNDFAHMLASLSVILNQNIGGSVTSLGTSSKLLPLIGSIAVQSSYGTVTNISAGMSQSGLDKAAAATFRGDIASGIFNQRDVRADIDALNIGFRLDSSRANSIETTINDYSRDLNMGTNRAKELANHYDNGDLNSGTSNLKKEVFGTITDPGDLMIEASGDKNLKANLIFTKDDAESFWKKYEKELGE